MIDYLVYAAVLSFTFAILAYLYKIIRVYRKTEVNCWFCNKNLKVKFALSNSFICPFCEQYNGFKEDGDYNCIIPAQHSEVYNSVTQQTYLRSSAWKVNPKFDNGFCEACNLNQALKIRALAEFSSFSSDDFDEIEKFKERLEEIYGLCQQCQATLNQTLGKQNSWLKPRLISWKLMQSKYNSLKDCPTITQFSSWKVLHCITLLVCLTLLVVSVEKYNLNVLQPLKTTFELYYLTFNETSFILIYAGIALQTVSIFLFTSKIFSAVNLVSFLGWSLMLFVYSSISLFPEEKIKHIQCASSIFNLVFASWFRRFMFKEVGPITRSRKERAQKMDNYFDFQSSPIHSNGSAVRESAPNTTAQNCCPNDSPQKDLDANLLSLKISTPKKNSGTFSPQNLFRDNENAKGRRNVVQPSKFGKPFITQSSWVAGGYWGSPGSPQRGRLTSHNVSHLSGEEQGPTFSTSRTSSQSSGFVSQMSERATPSLKSQNAFLNGSSTKYSHSQSSSIAEDPVERGSACSWGQTSPLHHASSFRSVGSSPNLETFEAHSACSASSFLSDNCTTPRPLSTHSALCCSNPHTPSIISNSSPSTKAVSLTSASYFNLGIAFVLGLSVSANIFLIIILTQYDIALK